MTGTVLSIVKSMRAEVRTTSIERGVYVQLSEIPLHFTSGLPPVSQHRVLLQVNVSSVLYCVIVTFGTLCFLNDANISSRRKGESIAVVSSRQKSK